MDNGHSNDNEPVSPAEFPHVKFLAACCNVSAAEMIRRASEAVDSECCWEHITYRISVGLQQSARALRQVMAMEALPQGEVGRIMADYAWSLMLYSEIAKRMGHAGKSALEGLPAQAQQFQKTFNVLRSRTGLPGEGGADVLIHITGRFPA